MMNNNEEIDPYIIYIFIKFYKLYYNLSNMLKK